MHWSRSPGARAGGWIVNDGRNGSDWRRPNESVVELVATRRRHWRPSSGLSTDTSFPIDGEGFSGRCVDVVPIFATDSLRSNGRHSGGAQRMCGESVADLVASRRRFWEPNSGVCAHTRSLLGRDPFLGRPRNRSGDNMRTSRHTPVASLPVALPDTAIPSLFDACHAYPVISSLLSLQPYDAYSIKLLPSTDGHGVSV